MGARLLRSLPLLGILLLSACAVERYDLEYPPRPTRPLAKDVLERFAYAHVTSATLTRSFADDDVEVSEGELTIRVPNARDPAPAEDDGTVPVKFEYWRSKRARGPAPLVVVTPILGGGKRLARTNCRDFARAGFHVVLAWRGTRVLRRTWPLANVERHLRRGVASRRALVDWAAARPEVDANRIGAFGISMGGILSSVFLAVEPRLRCGVIALAGGDIPQIICRSTEGRLVRFREQKMKTLKIDLPTLEKRLRRVFLSEPLALAKAVDPRGVLMITTRYDWVVDPTNQERLWKALGRPLRFDIPTGHYSGILYLPYITQQIVRWLERRLASNAAPGKT